MLMKQPFRRAVIVASFAVALLACWAAPVFAQVKTKIEPPDQIVLSGRVDVARGQTVAQVVVFRGSANVEGVALGDVVVFSGKVTVAGQVGGSVVNLDGPVVLAPSAQVRGDVISRQQVVVRKGAQVEGSVRSSVPFSLRAPLSWFGGFATWLAVTISTLLLGLALVWLVPRATELIGDVALESPLPASLWGLGWMFGAPLIAVVTMLSLLALPLGLTFLLALAFLYLAGNAWTGWAIGRLVLPDKGRYVTLLAGVGILRGVTFILGLVPVVGGLVWILAGAFGLGAASLALWRGRGMGGKHRPGRGRGVVPVEATGERATSPQGSSTPAVGA